MKRRLFSALGGYCLCLVLSGCVSGMLARKIVTAPNRQSAPWPPKGSEVAGRFNATYAQSWRVTVGPPAAELAVALIEPGDYRFSYGVMTEIRGENRVPRVSADWSPRRASFSDVPPRGTIVLLHGILMSKETMLHWALFLAQQNYRVVLLDLRGHGQSSGEWITYGAVEARDLVQVADDLEKRELIAGQLSVLGSSYGAAIALQWAARDARVGAVIALQPFSDPERAVVEFARGFPAFKQQAAHVGTATFDAALERAARLAGFSWSDANVENAVKRLRVPVLLFHGGRDTWLSPLHSETLGRIAPAGSRLVLLPEENHESLTARLDPLALDVADWLEALRPVRAVTVAAESAPASIP